VAFNETHLGSLFVRKSDHFHALTGLSLNLFRNASPLAPVHKPRCNSDMLRVLERSDSVKTQIRLAVERAKKGEAITFFFPLSLACTIVPLKRKWGDVLDYHIRMDGFFLDRRPSRVSREEVGILMECGLAMSQESVHEMSKGVACLPWTKLGYLAEEISRLGENLIQELEKDWASHPGIKRGMDFIHANLDQEFDLRMVAQHAGMSHCHFSRIFRQETGESFTRFVSRLRCNRAMDMLKSGNQRISEVAFNCGFQSLSQFNRSFVGIFGKNPTAFAGRAGTEKPDRSFSQNPVSE